MNKISEKIFKISLLLLGIAVIFSCGINYTFAANSPTIYVSPQGNDSWNGLSSTYINGTNGPKASIQNALLYAGTLYIDNGVYTGSGNNNVTIYSNITIIGQSEKDTIINGSSNGTIFNITSGVNVTIINLTFTNGRSYSGGSAIFNGYESTLTVDNSAFLSNGRGIDNEGSSLIVNNSTFINNSNGGAIEDFDGTSLIINNSTFINNTSSCGGAINNGGSLSINNSTFTNNTSNNGEGGAIDNGGNMIVTNSTFTCNSALDSGAINNGYENLTVDYCTFINNTASLDGGAIYNMGNMIIHFSRIIGNTAYNGNAIYNHNFSMLLDVSLNWWGSNAGPSVADLYGATAPSWLVLKVIASPTIIPNDSNSTVTANLLYTNLGALAGGYLPDGIVTSFTTTLGNINPSSIKNGIAQSTLYSGSTAGNATITVKLDNQTINTVVIINDTIPPTVKINLNGGLYNVNKIVTLTMSEPGTIYYTLNESTPTIVSTKYTGSITINKTTTLKYIAIDLAGNKSPVYSQTYTIDKIPPKISTTSPTNNAQSISLTSSITIKFSENITSGTNYSKIYVKNLNTGKIVPITKTISGNSLTIKQSIKRISYDTYEVVIPSAAIKDQAGNNLAATYTFKFRTV